MNIWNVGYLILGIYIGQEYGQQIPSVKIQSAKYYEEIQKYDVYKNLVKKDK